MIAYDKARKLALQAAGYYYEKAIETIRSNKEKYAIAETKSKAKTWNGEDPFTAAMARYAPS